MTAGSAPEAAGPGTRIYCADWVLPITSQPVSGGAVAVADGVIKAVGASDEVTRTYPEAEVVEFHDAIILPGFVNCHCHLEYGVFRGLLDNKNFGSWILDFIDYKRRLSPDDYLASALLGASECAASGITTVADSMHSGQSLTAIRKTGLRGRVYLEVFGIDDASLSETVSKLEATLDELQEQENGKVEVGIFPHATYTVSANLYNAISRLARERDKKVATHLAESRDESTYIKSGSGVLALDFREKVGWENIICEPFGVTPVKYLQQWDVYGTDFMAVHCVHVEARDIDILAKNDVAIAHCPKSNAKLGCGIAPLPDFLKAGIRVGLGTDSPASSNTMDMFGEMRTAIYLHRGTHHDATILGAADCLKMATMSGAAALGMDDRIGSLEAGKQADMIAVDMEYSHFTPVNDPYSSLVYGASQDDIFFTMVAGNPIYDKKVFTTLDGREINARAEEVKKKLSHAS
ncbi:MAG: amidohydrolase [Actinomycetota bacterium]